MTNTIGYIVFVSYNKEVYDNFGINIHDMSLTEFIDFNENDDKNCKTIKAWDITKNTLIGCNASEPHDDSIMWYIGNDMLDVESVKKFIESNID